MARPGVERGRLPVVRVRLACDTATFRVNFAAGIAADGVFVRAAHPRPVGARVELALHLLDGVVRGEALAVDAREGGESGPGATFRFVRLIEGSLGADEADASAAGSPGSGVDGIEPLFTPDEQRALLDASAVVEEPGAEPEETLDVPLRPEVLEARRASEEAARLRTARARRTRVRLAAAAVAAVGLAALSAHLVAGRRTDGRIAALVAAADERLASGRLAGGGDTALDRLVAARTLRPDDPQVRERLRLVADKLEELAEVAIARGDYAEAAVHLTAASQAEPQRKSVHSRLGELARSRGRPPAKEPAAAP